MIEYEKEPMLAKITAGEDCKYRLWQEDLFVEFTHIWTEVDGSVLLFCKSRDSRAIATIKGSSAKEFLRCFKIVKGEL